MENKKDMTYKKILIVNLAGIGDLLLSLPALKALRKSFPQAKICLLTSEKVYEIAKKIEFIDQIFCLKISYGGILGISSFCGHLISLLKLRKESFDLAVNMRTLVSDKSAKKMRLLLKIINPKRTAGRNTENRGSFFDLKIPETQIGEKYESEYDLELVEALGAAVIDKEIDFKVSADDAADIEQQLLKQNIPNNSLIIGIHPGGMPTRRWPIECFCQLIESLSKQIACYFVISGGYNEINLAQRLEKILPNKVISFAGKLNIQQTAALIAKCNIFIANDTGPMHIAAILKTPLIALFGPGDIKRFDPRIIFKSAIVFYNKQECAPCEQVNCDKMICMQSIKTEDVAKAVIELLKRTK
jgi:heptosyltransferase II